MTAQKSMQQYLDNKYKPLLPTRQICRHEQSDRLYISISLYAILGDLHSFQENIRKYFLEFDSALKHDHGKHTNTPEYEITLSYKHIKK